MGIRYWRWHEKAAGSLLATAVLFVTAPITAQAQAQPYPEIDQKLKILKDKFNADAGKVRILFIGDPTCPPCRHGTSVIEENVVKRFSTDKLVVYAVWVPLLNLQDPATLQRHAHQYEHDLPPGPRVTTYTDPESFTAKVYGAILGVPYGSPAWDVYLAFGADARWGESAPPPVHWEHQLGGMPTSNYLDGPRFAKEVRKLLAKIGQ